MDNLPYRSHKHSKYDNWFQVLQKEVVVLSLVCDKRYVLCDIT